jgi:hypothetical protein
MVILENSDTIWINVYPNVIPDGVTGVHKGMPTIRVYESEELARMYRHDGCTNTVGIKVYDK